jgi:hypothetical protein
MPETVPAVPAQPLGNDPATRTPEGTIKDPALETKPTSSSEAKPEATSTEAKPDAKAETKPDAGAPEKYDFKAPEGQTLDAKTIEAVTPIFKELGLTNDQAQKLVEFQAARDTAATDAAYKAYETTRTDWRKEIVGSDLGDGKEGLKPEIKKNIDTAIGALGDAKAIEGFKAAMDLTGAGDNPAFVRAMSKLGSLLAEGTPVRGTAPSPAGQSAPGTAKPSPAAAMYPNLATSSKP